MIPNLLWESDESNEIAPQENAYPLKHYVFGFASGNL